MPRKKYRCFNPVGIDEPVDVYPLAPRLSKLDGKTIHLAICGEPDITIPLEKRLKSDYPQVNWTIRKTYGIAPNEMTDEEIKTTDAMILGVCW